MPDTQILSSSTVVGHQENVFFENIDDDLIIVSIEKDMYYAIDPIGKVIWDCIASPKSIDQICDELTQAYDVDRATCEQDTLEFLNELFKRELIVIHDA